MLHVLIRFHLLEALVRADSLSQTMRPLVAKWWLLVEAVMLLLLLLYFYTTVSCPRTSILRTLACTYKAPFCMAHEWHLPT